MKMVIVNDQTVHASTAAVPIQGDPRNSGSHGPPNNTGTVNPVL